jgi:hypothetical protein
MDHSLVSLVNEPHINTFMLHIYEKDKKLQINKYVDSIPFTALLLVICYNSPFRAQVPN